MARINSNVIASEKNMTPASAAIIGTDSCKIAAKEVFNDGNTEYHIIYPRPDVIAPDIIAKINPLKLIPSCQKTKKMPTIGVAQTRF
jgi:hypothetical protein